MKRWWLLVPCLAVFAVLLLEAQPAAAIRTYSHDRDGAVVGLNIGWGWSRVEYADGQGGSFISDHLSALAGGLRLSWAKDEYLMYGFDFHGWTKNDELVEYSILTGTVTLHWFPGGQGFFARGGAGFGSLDVKVKTLPQFTRFTQGGWSFTAGLGYELRLSPQFALGAAYDFYYIPLGDFEGFEDVKGYNSNLTFNLSWYII